MHIVLCWADIVISAHDCYNLQVLCLAVLACRYTGACHKTGWLELLPGVSLKRSSWFIFDDQEYSQLNPATVTTAEPVASPPVSPGIKKGGARPQKRWLSKSFRFSLKSFLPGGGALSLRRFSITEAAALLMLAFIASRGLGVARQTLFNILFGTGPEANAYYAAARLPETLFDLVAGGALTHAFIPVFLSYEKDHGQREAWRLTSLVFNVMLVALTLLVIAGEFLTPAFVNSWLVPGYAPSEQALTTDLTRVMLIQPLLLGLGTVITAALNSKRQFLLPAFAVAIYNVGLIAGLGVSFLVPGVGIYGPTYGILAATALQALVMVPALVKQGARYSFTWNLRHPGLHEVLRLLIPNMLATAFASIAPIIDTAFISFMPDNASLAALRNAYMLFGLPLTLVAQAVGQAALPQLTSLATARKYVRLRSTLLKVLLVSLAFSILAALALALFGRPAIRIVFQYGAFGVHSAYVTHLALLGYAVALPAQAATLLLILAFYATKNALVPLYTSMLALLAHLGAALLFLQIFSGSYQILAIPLALAAESVVTTLLLAAWLFFGLRSQVRNDRGMQRLERRRAYLKNLH
ncbi:MAG TPA: murein biosynthesis integral membrane protein MurJ [Ktedonobacteraceae bacterium]|nr:murein biosynthesis integral membrane protein MurJ [Ktedonobacteraceae bacterium]